MTFLLVFASVLFLLAMIVGLRLNAFIALIITAFSVGLCKGMPGLAVAKSVQTGIGSTLSALVLVLGFGIMLGKILTESGAARQLTRTLLRIFGPARAKYALALTAFIVGLAMFYNAGFVILLPLVLTMAADTGLPLIYLATAMASALSITHGFLPPHPGPTAIAIMFKANMGLTLLYGIVVSIPALIVAGIIFPETLRNMPATLPAGWSKPEHSDSERLPGFGLSLLVATLPVLLMGAATIGELTLPAENGVRHFLAFIGEPGVAMLLAVLVAIATLGIGQGRTMTQIGQYIESSVGSIAMILLIIAGGGAFKQVLTDSGIGNEIAGAFSGSTLSPLFLGWLIAALVRITLGSATIAGLMAGGIMTPMLATTGASPELLTLAIGAGSLACSHVNDTGFWMFKEYFGLTLYQTFRSWTVMETIVSVMGLIGVLLMDLVV